MHETQEVSSRPRLLWIDDQCDQAAVRLLALEGIVVDCATSAAQGLEMASAGYSGIILDLRLPDASGLSVLEALRCRRDRTPVMLLTGFADVPSAVAAMRLGAIDYKTKPLFGDDWIRSTRALLDAGAVPVSDRLSPLRAALAALADGGLAATAEAVILRLARAAADPDLELPHFVACAEALRRTIIAAPACDPSELAAEADEIITHTVNRLGAVNAKVDAAFDAIAEGLTRGCRSTGPGIADAVGLTAADLERLLAFETGWDFAHWRCLLSVRRGVQSLAGSDEQVAQIAYSLGFEHPGQFDREFRRLLAIAPREFRRLIQASPL